MKHLRAGSLLLCFCCLAGQSIAAPHYIENKPLNQVVKSKVGTVKGGRIQVPVITWGADINVIQANGGEVMTTAGSLFGQSGFRAKIKRQDNFAQQIREYISGKTPFLRGTLGMISMASDVLNRDPRTKPVIIYQLSESAGGDALVVKSNIKQARDLRGKTIAVQAYGPHVDYLTKILRDAGLSVNDVTIKWLPDLTGTQNTPMNALYENNIDAAMVIIPDALALTSGGNVGTGAEDSVKGARILLSTKTANRIIADVYAVRSDFYKQKRGKVESFVRGLISAREKTARLFNQDANSPAARKLMKSSAKILLDSEQAIADVQGLYADAYHANVADNAKFFTDSRYPRNMKRRVNEIKQAFRGLGLIQNVSLATANWNWGSLGTGQVASAEVKRFDESKLAKAIARKQQQGTLGDTAVFTFEIFFKPNQKTFNAELYRSNFEEVIEKASTYGGAVITVEGHSDPLGYLRKKKQGIQEIALRRIKQAARNLSLSRANAVRDNIVAFAKSKGITLDTSQFAVVGHGINSPASGMCGSDPCAPRTEQQWRNNMRVVFRIISLEAESDVFRPL